MESKYQGPTNQNRFAIKYRETIKSRSIQNKSMTKTEAKVEVKGEYPTRKDSQEASNKIKYTDRIRDKLYSVNINQLQSARHSTKTQNMNESAQTERYLEREATQPSKGQEGGEQKRLGSVKDKAVSCCKNSVKSNGKNTISLKDRANIPLDFSEETPWAGLRGRLVYRGRTPKNSYYLLNNLKEYDENSPEQTVTKNSFDSDLQFNSRFQSGNLQGAIRISKKEYWLFMRQDTNTFGLRQWFFFEVSCNRPLNITFRIYKFSKKYSLHRHGMKPYIKETGEEWAQKGDNLSYNYDQEMKCYYLKFNFGFGKERQRILVAGMPPYTFSRLTRYLQSFEDLPGVSTRSIGVSLGGIEIPLIEIVSPQLQENKDQKRAIIILGRTHPAETCSNYSIQSIVAGILQDSKLRAQFDVFVVPMVNPDGVIVGNHRTSLAGIDLNRKFTFSSKLEDKELFPEVWAVKDLVKMVSRSHKIQFLIDLHGHSAKRNLFAYGEQQILKSDRYLKSRVIPKLLSEHLSSFKYDSCIFQSYKEKQKTARIYFGKYHNINALTIEQSYGFVEMRRIGIEDWRAFGQVLAAVMQVYMQRFMDDSEGMMEKLKTEIGEDAERTQAERVEGGREEQKFEFAGEMRQKSIKKMIEQPRIKEEHIRLEQESESDLESGDQQLQNTDEGLELLRNRIVFPRPRNDPIRRQSIVIPDTNIELSSEHGQPLGTILHQQKIPIISRIMRMRERRKQPNGLIDLLTHRHQKESGKYIRDKIREYKIKLPNLEKFLF